MKLHNLRTFRIFPLLLLFFISVPEVKAQLESSLSLTDSMRLMEASSPQMKKAEAIKEEAQGKKKEAFSIFLPRLIASGQHLVDNKFMTEKIGALGMTIELIQPYTLWSLRAEWSVFDGLASFDYYAAQSYSASAMEKEADWSKFQARQEVKMKFFKALAAIELEKVANQNVKTLNDHLDRAKALRQSGVGTNFDVLRVEVQLNEAQSEKLNSEDNVIMSRQALLNSLGVEEENRKIVGALPAPSASKINSLEKPTSMDRLDYQAIMDREISAQKSYSAAFKHWLPRFTVYGQTDYYNNVSKGITDQDYNNAYTFGVNMSWTFFDGFASTSRASQARAREIQAIENSRQARLKNKFDFDFWKRRYLYSASLYKAKMDDVDKAQESVRLASQSFKAGARTSSEVLDAELDLFRARAGVVNAQLNAVEALVNLELAVGKEL